MKALNLTLLIAIFTMGCDAQDLEKNVPEFDEDQPSVNNSPKESWRINKEVDEDGNVTRYDSTYTWSYSNTSGDSVDVNVDSVLRSFDEHFSQRMPSLWGSRFLGPMWRDSALHSDFFKDDYFYHQWKKNMYDMQGMFRQMDSVRNKFFEESYPGMMHPADSNDLLHH